MCIMSLKGGENTVQQIPFYLLAAISICLAALAEACKINENPQESFVLQPAQGLDARELRDYAMCLATKLAYVMHVMIGLDQLIG